MTITHQKSGTPEYLAWTNIKRRCYNKNNASYHAYGARGIKMCDRWREDFLNFLADMGERPSDLHSIDRIDVNGDYEPANCRWTTNAEQQNNKRSNIIIEHDGRSQTMTAWAREIGINTDTLWRRLNVYGKTVAEALTADSLNKKPDLIHGTRQGYEYHKCRCDECKAFNAKRHAAYLASKSAKHELRPKA